ncbi:MULTISPECIES: hypothetical protein [Mycetocola]|uniref:hypothetical protein n=1 Tax=Mycetocola TaxID=76634 RepID=UPI002169C856|nr:hypothetical protein [Mycetocola sp. BIGb0189]MCS4277458.1 hypothetical protein [Mycetocola sp. BIGb0189]
MQFWVEISQIGSNFATLMAVLVAGFAWLAYRGKRDKEIHVRDQEKHEREKIESQQAAERFYREDLNEAAELHRELTNASVAEVLAKSAANSVAKYQVEALHSRASARFHVWRGWDEPPSDGSRRLKETEVPTEMLALIAQELDSLRNWLGQKDSPSPQGDSGSGVDRTKYEWGVGADGVEVYRGGKFAILALIAAKFARDAKISSHQEFVSKFGAEVRSALELEESVGIDGVLLLDELDYKEQRERYAIRDRRWIAERGPAGYLTFDGKNYRTGWNLGVKPGAMDIGVAEKQKRVIAHFKSLNYPIKELSS